MKLNIEQRKIIELEPSGHVLVKGVAGSGKTTVAIRRVAFLQEHFCPENDDKILLVTYNTTLLKYIKNQYENLEEEDLYLMPNLFSSNENKVVIESIDKLMFQFFKKYQARHKTNYRIAEKNIVMNAIQQAIFMVREQFPDIKLLSPKYSSFLIDEIQWIKACNIPDLTTYQEIDRIGRSNGGTGNPQKLTKNSDTRAAIYKLMELYDKILLNHGYVDFKTMNRLALQEAAEVNTRQYTHIIIDECQDLSKVQLEFLKQLHKQKSYSSIMFVADNTQSIYSQSWLGKGRPYTTIGYDMSGKARTLSKNYRTTTEISKAAYSLIEKDEQIQGNVDFVKPSLIDRHGHAPIYRFFMNAKKQSEFLLEEIKTLQNDYHLREICIVAKEKRLIESTATVLEEEGIPCEILNNENPNFEAESVKLTTMHSIKGMEFKVIFLIHLDEDVIPKVPYGFDDIETIYTEERKLLYVGMTRSNELLYMTSVRNPSPLLKDIDKNLLRFRKDSSLRPFKSISIQDYQLKNQIVDLNAKEEVIRQWLLHEIINTFHYPLELISLEYPVQQYSKRGYVDIAVSIEMKGKRIPYIFAEVKSFGRGIDLALEQLKSYMNADPNVRYGIVTDGVEIHIIDRNDEILTDIPPCQPQFMPNKKITREYKDLRHDRTYLYNQEIDDETNIEIVDPKTKLSLDCSVDVQVPVIGNVAAGIPTTAIENVDDYIFLNKDWIIQANQTYALRVTGDSMIDFGIDQGDLVIVHKQQVVCNGDIVIALIGQEATMKKFMRMGDSIILIPGNSNYEPIQMNPNDVVINGKVIGVLKEQREHQR